MSQIDPLEFKARNERVLMDYWSVRNAGRAKADRFSIALRKVSAKADEEKKTDMQAAMKTMNEAITAVERVTAAIRLANAACEAATDALEEAAK